MQAHYQGKKSSQTRARGHGTKERAALKHTRPRTRAYYQGKEKLSNTLARGLGHTTKERTALKHAPADLGNYQGKNSSQTRPRRHTAEGRTAFKHTITQVSADIEALSQRSWQNRSTHAHGNKGSRSTQMRTHKTLLGRCVYAVGLTDTGCDVS